MLTSLVCPHCAHVMQHDGAPGEFLCPACRGSFFLEPILPAPAFDPALDFRRPPRGTLTIEHRLQSDGWFGRGFGLAAGALTAYAIYSLIVAAIGLFVLWLLVLRPLSNAAQNDAQKVAAAEAIEIARKTLAGNSNVQLADDAQATFEGGEWIVTGRAVKLPGESLFKVRVRLARARFGQTVRWQVVEQDYR